MTAPLTLVNQAPRLGGRAAPARRTTARVTAGQAGRGIDARRGAEPVRSARAHVAAVPALIVAAIVAAIAIAPSTDTPAPPPPALTASPTPAQSAVFTGEYVDGIPVWRLPALTVVAPREATLAEEARRPSSSGAPPMPQKGAAPEASPPG